MQAPINKALDFVIKGALKLAELGFRVKELIGGIDWWKRDGYATERELVTIS